MSSEDYIFGGTLPSDFGLRIFEAKIKVGKEIKEYSFPAEDIERAKVLLFKIWTRDIPDESIELLSLKEQ